MKKIIALLMVLAMVFALVACSGGSKDADAIPDTMTSSDGKYEIAFVTDVGQLKDKSFNQGTWEGCKLYASANNKSYKYYQPANADKAWDDDRYDAMKAAVDGGAIYTDSPLTTISGCSFTSNTASELAACAAGIPVPAASIAAIATSLVKGIIKTQ